MGLSGRVFLEWGGRKESEDLKCSKVFPLEWWELKSGGSFGGGAALFSFPQPWGQLQSPWEGQLQSGSTTSSSETEPLCFLRE